ncbi:MAG: PH domain-containing protein, partial [Acidimicrobiales bacterium]
ATRLWRWRSHKVHLTSQRIVVEGGVLQHTTSEVELHNLVKTRIDQHWRDRLARRGVVVVETPAGTLNLGMVRHPAALCRLIDNERRYLIGGDVEKNAVFDFDAPGDEELDAGGRRHRGRRL